MKNSHYKNKVFHKKNFNKNNGMFNVIGFLPKQKGKPKFLTGDLVGLKSVYVDISGKIIKYRYEKSGELVYDVECQLFYNSNYSASYKEFELYLKPLTRNVLFEKIKKINPSLFGVRDF